MPSVGPSMPDSMSRYHNAYPEAEDLMANHDALNRLAGKHSVRRNENVEVVDVQVSLEVVLNY